MTPERVSGVVEDGRDAAAPETHPHPIRRPRKGPLIVSAIAPARPDPTTATTRADIARRLELATARGDIDEHTRILAGLRTAGLGTLAAELAADIPAGKETGR
jgi:hypothetical protein